MSLIGKIISYSEGMFREVVGKGIVLEKITRGPDSTTGYILRDIKYGKLVTIYHYDIQEIEDVEETLDG